MKNKIILTLILIFIFILSLSGCRNKNSFNDTLKPVKTESFSNFGALAMPDCEKGITGYASFIDDFIKDNACLFEGEEYDYAVMKIEDINKYLFILYRKNDGYVVSSILADKLYDEKDLTSVKEGVPFSVIKEELKIDSNYKNNDTNEYCLYMTDGGYIIINLDKNKTIESVEKYKNEYGFMDILKKSDSFDIKQLFY